jgi:hypothetical protein
VLTTDLAAEKDRAIAAEGVLTTNLASEVTNRIADVDAEQARATAAEGVLTTNLASEVTNRIADVDAEQARATAAEGVLTTNLASEVADRTALIRQEADGIHIGPNSLITNEAVVAGVTTQQLFAEKADGSAIDIVIANGSNLQVEGNAAIGGNLDMTSGQIKNLAIGTLTSDAVNLGQMQSADNQIRTDFAAADNSIRSDYQAADRGLRSDIDQNTRGIAMVAAMTNTTVAAGKTHGVDFNVAQFQDETGMSFGYANRINENLQIHAAAASTTDFDEAVARIGVSYQW